MKNIVCVRSTGFSRVLIVMLLVGLSIGAYSAEDAKEEGFVPLFNGKDLTGWEGDAKLWVVEDGVLIGRSPGIAYNDFLSTTKTYADFILRYDIRLVDNKGNTGVQFRSKRTPGSHEVSGFQADAADGWWMTLYDEARRNKPLVKPDPAELKKALKPADWNAYEVKAVGNTITMSLNGVKLVEYTEKDPAIAPSGIIATQIHGGDPMEVQFRNIRIKEINPPPAYTKGSTAIYPDTSETRRADQYKNTAPARYTVEISGLRPILFT